MVRITVDAEKAYEAAKARRDAENPTRQRILKYKKDDESYEECLNHILDEYERMKKSGKE